MAYAANGVDFDGTNDYLTRDADLTGTADGKVGTLSLWVRRDGGTGASMNIFYGKDSADNKGAFRLRFGATDNFNFICRGPGISTIRLRLDSDTAYATTGVWIHYLASWNLATPEAYLFINDIDDEAAGSTETDAVLDLTHDDWGVGARPQDGDRKLNGCLADFYWAQEFIDITVESNRRLFIDGSGNVVDLGSDGSTPTGTAPIIFFSGVTSTWHTNDGTGGGFTEVGAIADCSDDPPVASDFIPYPYPRYGLVGGLQPAAGGI